MKKVDVLKEKLDLYEKHLHQPKVLGLTKEQLEKEIQILKTQIEKSKRGKGNRQKGSNYENTIAKKLSSFFNILLKRTPQSGGFAKESNSDIKGDLVCLDKDVVFNLHVECKNQKSINIKKWLEQAERDCPEGKIAIVIFHLPQLIEGGKIAQKANDYVVLSLSDFLLIVDKQKVVCRER